MYENGLDEYLVLRNRLAALERAADGSMHLQATSSVSLERIEILRKMQEIVVLWATGSASGQPG